MATSDQVCRLSEASSQLARELESVRRDFPGAGESPEALTQAPRFQEALAGLSPRLADNIADAMSLLAGALSSTKTKSISNSASDPAPPPAPGPTPAQQPKLEIIPGYIPGILASTLDMHIKHYHAYVSWGLTFETELSRGLGDLLNRLARNPDNQAWAAVRTKPSHSSPSSASSSSSSSPSREIIGTIFIDGENIKDTACRTAQVRAFIVDKSARGLGAGKKLLGEALAFVEDRGFDQVVLHTLGEASAVYLYRSAGFELDWDEERIVWEQKVRQMHFTWRRQGAPAAEAANLDEEKLGDVLAEGETAAVKA